MTAGRLYWIVATSGAVFMAFEILSARILSPHFGNSVYVWGSIISVFLAALSIGYAWGGRVADRHPYLSALGRLLTLAAAFQAPLILLGDSIAEYLANLTGGHPAGTLLAATVLFGPASVLFGTISPYAVRLASKDIAAVGNTAGRLYAVSTTGSLVGTLLCTFVLIPALALHAILVLLLAMTLVAALLALLTDRRREMPALVLTILLMVLAVKAGTLKEGSGTGVVYQRATPYQSFKVVDIASKRSLISDRIVQGAVEIGTGEPALSYARHSAAALLYRPELKSVLALGMGTGSVGQYLVRRLPGIEVDYVEIDPAVPEIAKRFFFFEEGPALKVHVSDARRFLTASDSTWDFIYVDVYIGQAVPFHLTTTEFFGEVKRHLAPGGVLGFNVAAGLNSPFTRALYRTIAGQFPLTTAFDIPDSGNFLFLATEQASWVPSEELLERARRLDLELAFEPSLEEIAATQVPIDFELSSLPTLTDDYAPVEHLVLLSSAPIPDGR